MTKTGGNKFMESVVGNFTCALLALGILYVRLGLLRDYEIARFKQYPYINGIYYFALIFLAILFLIRGIKRLKK